MNSGMRRTETHCANGHLWLLYAAIDYRGNKECLECQRLQTRKSRLEKRLANFFKREDDEQNIRSRRLRLYSKENV